MNKTKEKKLEIIAEHLPYEISMLKYSESRLQNNQFQHQFEVNILLESFCIHARNLIDFFYATPGKKYSAARDFTTKSYKPFNGKTDIKETIEYKKINNQVSHLTHSRTTKSEEKISGADRAKLLSLIIDEVVLFTSHLENEFKAPFLKKIFLSII